MLLAREHILIDTPQGIAIKGRLDPHLCVGVGRALGPSPVLLFELKPYGTCFMSHAATDMEGTSNESLGM